MADNWPLGGLAAQYQPPPICVRSTLASRYFTRKVMVNLERPAEAKSLKTNGRVAALARPRLDLTRSHPGDEEAGAENRRTRLAGSQGADGADTSETTRTRSSNNTIATGGNA